MERQKDGKQNIFLLLHSTTVRSFCENHFQDHWCYCQSWTVGWSGIGNRMWVWFHCSVFSELAALNFPPVLCTHIHNFHICSSTTKVPISLIFKDFLEGLAFQKLKQWGEELCPVVLTEVVKRLASSYLYSQFWISFFLAFYLKLTFLSFNCFPLC